MPVFLPLLMMMWVVMVTLTSSATPPPQSPSPPPPPPLSLMRIGSVDTQEPHLLDTSINEGVRFWVDYINNQPGALLNGMKVEHSSVNVGRNITEGFTKLVEKGVSVVVSPYSYDRTTESLRVTQANNVITFGVSGDDDLFSDSYTSYFSASRKYSQPSAALQLIVDRVDTYAVISTKAEVDIANGVIQYMSTVPSSPKLVANRSDILETTNSAQLNQTLSALLYHRRKVDLLICILGFEGSFGKIRAAVQMLPSDYSFNAMLFLPTIGLELSSGDIEESEGWLVDVPFLNTLNTPLTSYGGFTKEFFTLYNQTMRQAPNAINALTVANLMAYRDAVHFYQSIDNARVKEAFVAMGCESSSYSFLGKVCIANKTTSLMYSPVQYQRQPYDSKSKYPVLPIIVNEDTVMYPSHFYNPKVEVIKSNSDPVLLVICVSLAVVVAVLLFIFARIVILHKGEVEAALLQAEEGAQKKL